MRLTPEVLLATLPKHYQVQGAAAELGVRSNSIRDACRRFGLGCPSKLLCSPSDYGKRLAQPDYRTRAGLDHVLRAPRSPQPMPKSIIVCPDVHRPFHDKKAWALFVKVCKTLKPDAGVIIGDFPDCYSISFHPKSPARRANLKYEIEDTNEGLDELQETGIRSWTYCEGNHEFRLERFLAQKCPELFGLVEITELLKIAQRGFEWVPYKKWTRIGKVAFSHEVGHAGKTAGQKSLEEFGGNIVFGHSHRGGTFYGGTVDGEKHVALNVGWLGDVDAIDYTHQSKTRGWQHGFGWVDLDNDGNGWCTFVPIIEGRAIVHGERIGL